MSPDARYMRLLPFILGILGGLAGLGVHAVLLVQFFSRSHGLFAAFMDLALAAALGVAALVVSSLCRTSLRALAVFLPIFGGLGFVARPLSWAPAGALLLVAGALACVGVFSGGGRPAGPPPSAAVGPDGRPLHWSEAARLGIPVSPPVGRAAAPRERGWSAPRKAAVAAAGLLCVVIVVPLALLGWDSGPAGQQPVALQPSTTLPATTIPSDTTTTTAPPRTTTTAASDDGFDTFVNEEFAFSLSYPAAWRNTDPGEVGPRIYGDRSRAMAQAYQDAFVAAAFADWQGPTHDGCYLDFVWVEAYEGAATDNVTMTEAKRNTEEFIDLVKRDYPGVELLEPVRDVRIGTLAGFSYTWSLPVDHRNLIAQEVLLAADGAWYYLALAAIEDDWDECKPLFEEILRSFTVHGSSPVI